MKKLHKPVHTTSDILLRKTRGIGLTPMIVNCQQSYYIRHTLLHLHRNGSREGDKCHGRRYQWQYREIKNGKPHIVREGQTD